MRRMRILFPILVAIFILTAGIVLTSPTQAQDGSTWLAFGSSSLPGEPGMTLLSVSPSQIKLAAALPGAYADTQTAAGGSYTVLSGDGYGHPAGYGMPDVPVLRREVEIPFGAQVTVEVISADYTDTSLAELGLYPIYPLQPPVPKMEGAEDSQPFTIDSKFYTSGSLYPSSVVSIGEPYIIRGHRIVQVEVWPVGYDPSRGMVRLYSQVTLRLNLSGADMDATRGLAERYASPAFDPSLSRRVLNYNQGLALSGKDLVGLLIISSDAYVDALAPLVTLRESRGFDVTLTNQDDIPGGTTTAGIKAYIQAAYDTWPLPPSYILLVGDTNTLPTWTGPVIGTSTDLYYGTMEGSSDWHPDILRGRFPVRSVADTTAMVDKYLEYAELTGQEAWLKTASFPATCDNYTVAEGTHNYVINTHTAPGDWTGNFPEPSQPGGDKLYCVTYSADHADLIEMFNQGRWAIIYSGHGSYGGWEMDFTPTDVDNLTAYGMYPFVASHACLSGDFGQPEVFGETWVLQQGKGALVYWGSSTYSYWGEDDVLERDMFDSLFYDDGVTPHHDVGAMTDDGLAGVEQSYPSSARYYRETYNVLGDPSVRLFIEPEMPMFTLNADPTSFEVCTEGTVTSTVTIGSVMNYSATVYLDSNEPPFILASFDPQQAAAPYTSILTLDVSAGALEDDYTVIITGTDQVSLTQVAPLSLRVNTALPAVPALLSPADGAADQPFTPSLEWEELALVSSYNFELDDSPLFAEPLVSVAGLSAAEYTLEDPLQGGRCYWWRTQADNACGTGSWAEPFHFSTVALGFAFFDALESGASQWSHTAAQGTDHWAISTAQSHSPTHAWFVPDDSVETDSYLWTTGSIQLGVGSELSFWHRYEFEGTSYDGAVLELSTDDGASWSDLGDYITANGYNGSVSTCCSNPLGGQAAWTGDLTDWTEVKVDLDSFAGEEVIIRWRFGADYSIGDTGWYIDDVLITAPLPPNPAPTLELIDPDIGDSSATTPVVITGTDFFGSPALRLGETWLISVTVVSTTTIDAVVPAGMPDGIYGLELFNGDCQSAILPEAFTVVSEVVPISGLEAENDSPTYLGGTTHFTATLDTGSAVSYSWDFDDGIMAEGQWVAHVYAQVGTYTATVTASNAAGSVTATTEVVVLVPPQVNKFIFLPVVNK